MNNFYTLHRCDPAGFECTGGGDNPHVCEVDSIHQSACQTCSKFPTDSKILKIVMNEHFLYFQGDYGREKEISYRDKRLDKIIEECYCPIMDLWRDGHLKDCPDRK